MPSPRCGFSFEVVFQPKINDFRIHKKCYFPVKFLVSLIIFVFINSYEITSDPYHIAIQYVLRSLNYQHKYS